MEDSMGSRWIFSLPETFLLIALVVVLAAAGTWAIAG
jgi:hypothetical protein